MSQTLEKGNESATKEKSKIPIIDCDVHLNPRTYDDLLPYLDDYWRDFMKDANWVGLYQGVPPMVFVNSGHRVDSTPPEGGLGGSSLSFYKEQVADKYNYAYSIIYPDSTFNLAGAPQARLATAVARAYNDWQIDQWLSKDSSFLGSVVVAAQDPEEAAKEIDRVGSHPQIVQVALSSRCPGGGWGDKRYHPIWEAAVRNNLVCSFHVASPGGLFRDGFPASSVPESQTNNGFSHQAALSSLVFGGVLEKYRDLRVAMIEGGFVWAINMMYTMDTHWQMSIREVPFIKRPPSQQVREQVWFGTQPMLDPLKPEEKKHIVEIAEMIGRDRLLFTSDYPHFTFDAPNVAFAHFPSDFRKKILYENAAELYGLKV